MDNEKLYIEVSKALKKANIKHNTDYIDLIQREIDESKCSKERFFLRKIIKNEKIASFNNTPLCQDTGILNFYIYFPEKFDSFYDIENTITEAVKDVYIKNSFRDSVRDFSGKKIEGNLPCSFLYFPTKQKELTIKFLVKGGGSENVSTLLNMLPSSNIDDVIERIVEHFKSISDRGCPPYFAGICIGGSMETSVVSSRIALLDIDLINMDELEKKVLKRINALDVGVFGTGFGKTALGLKIVKKPFHIASLFVAISVCCHQFRRGIIRLKI